jgi:pimeloyl-ACP methyl ester carboxylesterase
MARAATGATMSSEMRVGFRNVDGLQIRFADSDESESSTSEQVVLTSPWPESLLAFGRVWPRLSATAQVVAVDLPGFGRSERRTDLLSPAAMGEFLVRLLDDWGIVRPHLVCPDVGTAAALFAAANHPERICSLVVGGGAAAYPLQVEGTLKDLIEAPSIDAFRSLDPRELVSTAMAGLGTAAPGADVVDDYVESNAGERFAEAARYVRTYPDQLRVLSDLLPKISAPVQIITGRWDPLVPTGNAEYLEARLPNSRLDVLDAGHFAWEEAAERYAAIIAAWIAGGHLTVRP